MLGELSAYSLVSLSALVTIAMIALMLKQLVLRVTTLLALSGKRNLARFVARTYNGFASFYLEVEVSISLCLTGLFLSWYFNEPALTILVPFTFVILYAFLNKKIRIDLNKHFGIIK